MFMYKKWNALNIPRKRSRSPKEREIEKRFLRMSFDKFIRFDAGKEDLIAFKYYQSLNFDVNRTHSPERFVRYYFDKYD